MLIRKGLPCDFLLELEASDIGPGKQPQLQCTSMERRASS